MAEIKVSQLPEASEINDNDLIMIVQNNVNKKITKENCKFASGDEISIGTTQPVEDEKLWIKSDETTDQARYKDGNTWKKLSIKALDSMEIGLVIDYAGKEEKIPVGWLICDGSAISRTEYSELFDAIGTKWGTGDGSTTFNLPPAGIVRVGYDANDNDFNVVGKTGGEKAVQLTTDNLASNTINTATTGSNSDGYIMRGGYTASGTYNIGGSGVAHNNIQPYGTFYTIIKAKNTTPTMASVVNAHSTSTTDTYSCDYENKHYGGVVLYENENGTTGNVTLSETIANFNYLEIEYVRSGYTKSTGKIKANATPTLDGYWYYYDSGLGKVVFQNYCEIPEISGTTITRRDTYYTNVVGDGGGTYTGNFPNGISITRVVGYK